MRVGMLGPFEVRADEGGLVDVPGARLRGLLAALALRVGQVVPKGSLVDFIWGEAPPVDAGNALQRLVSRLRKVLPDGVIEAHTDGYRLVVEADAVDAVRFERLVRGGGGEALREALGLWRGAALQDVGLPESAALAAAAVRLEELRLTAVEEWADGEIAVGRGAVLVAELTDLVAAHPVRERLVAALMRALVAAGRDSAALQVFQRAREALADALGVDPSPELAGLHVSLLRGEIGRRGGERRTNLRAELTSFVGKDADVAAVRELLAEHRLTTLIGPGGAGKTRLATETGHAMLGDLPDGVWLVELAAVGAGADVAAVAQATLGGLDLRDALLGGAPNAEPADRLIAAIRDRETLLILDNCEHVVEAAALLAYRLLGACRGLRILATSREPLGITGEALWPVEPLALPTGDAAEPSAAVELLRDRGRAARRDLATDGPALATMARICRALDGMPLAIELAAARLRTMSIDQLAARLDDRFRLLTGGSRAALPRHRTLRAAVDWSWELLSGAERTVLRRLAVFSGGASLAAAERVCAGAGAEVAPAQVLELLTALADKSLLRADGDDRYRMIGTIREYAWQRLTEAGEADSARRAHLAYFTELAETAEPRLRRADQLDWLALLEAEHDNIGAAMRGAVTAGEAQAAMRLAAGAGWYWWLGGHRAEGIELLTAAARTPGEVTDEVRAIVCALIVHFIGSGRGDERQAEAWVHEAYRLSLLGRPSHPGLAFVGALERMLREPGAALSAFAPLLDSTDPWVRALARLQMGKMRIVLGHGGHEADAHLAAALAQFQALGERFGISFALTEVADRMAVRGEFARAAQHYEQAITVVTEAGTTEDVIRMRSRQAQLYWLLGDEPAVAASIAEAERHAARVTWPDALSELALAKAGLARWRGDGAEARRQLDLATAVLGAEAEQPGFRAMTHTLLGYLTADLDAARAHVAAACAAAAEAGYPMQIGHVLVGVADLALRQGDPAQAARLLAAGTAVCGLPDRSLPDLARIEQAARDRLGEVRYAEAAAEGAQADWPRLAEVTLAS